MEHYRIEISDLAKAQLVEIRDYIAKELYSPVTARKTLHLVEKNILSLSKLPHRHEKNGGYGMEGIKGLESIR